MLRADARQHTVTRMHQSTQFLDIPDVPCAHFRHKHLRRGRQALTDDFRHAHWRIEAARRNQCLILLLQNRAKNELDARLAVAAGNADFDDVRARRQFFGERTHPGQELEIRLGKVHPLQNDFQLLETREI